MSVEYINNNYKQNQNNEVISKITKFDLIDFINFVHQYTNLDKKIAYALAINAIKYYRGNPELRQKLQHLQKLEVQWYDSLNRGIPDYSVYNDQYFLSDLWSCWVVYSRQYLKNINSKTSLYGKSIVDDMKNVSSIADLGCGFGYTTAALKQIFTNAKVYGTNIPTSIQYKIASDIGRRYNFSMIENAESVGQIDLIFASEYFEHIEKPIDHLLSLIKTCRPRYFILANAFNTKSVGHFIEYIVDNNTKVDQSKMNKLFNDTLIANGYIKVKTKCWNQRPAYWKLK